MKECAVRKFLDPVPSKLRPRLDWKAWPYFSWAIAAIVLAIALLVLWSSSAAGQSNRGSQLMIDILATTPDAARGAELYARHCATCHGALGLGNAAAGIPALAGQHPRYLVKQLVDAAEGDRPVVEMHRVIARTELIGSQPNADVVAFMSTLKPNRRNEVGPGAQLDRGSNLYAQQCAACHGKRGEAAANGSVPALRGQHYSYLIAQMRELSRGHRYSVDIDVIERLEAMSLEDLEAVADFASRMSHATAARVPLKPNGLSEQAQ
jgi:cytochrome c553